MGRTAECLIGGRRLVRGVTVNGDIELEIGAGSGVGSYVVRVLHAAAGGEPVGTLELDVEEMLSRRGLLEATVLASALPRRSVSAAEQPVREVGLQLFQALFTGPVYGMYRASLGVARQRGRRLRVVLRLTAPELAALPWEMLFDPETETYLCRQEPLVRHVHAPYTADPLEVRPPLRILGLVASPRDLPQLDVDAEKGRLAEALAGPVAAGLIEVVWVPEATWHVVQDRLLAGQWHVLHFVGHGDYDTATDEGVLALVGANGRADRVEAGRLADLLGEAQPTPQLVVLNSCSSGQAGANDLFSGTAAALARSGISAVAAMQFAISDTAAIAFARGFYTAIAHSRNIDEAARSGRISILGTPRSLEWVTPVLYLRGQASQLFTLTAPPAAARETPPGHTSRSEDRKPPADSDDPAVFEPPRARNLNFTGRQALLEMVRTTLQPGVHAALLQAVTGLGGIGKTELVTEYAHRHRDSYDVVWSLRAESTATLLGDMRELASKLGLSQAPAGLSQRVGQWLQDHGRWLLIFDNATSLSDIQPYLPIGPGHVLITSRDQVWRQSAAVIEVDTWLPEESAEFLRKRLGRKKPEDERAGAVVAQVLGHLPLALEQAAAFMEQNGTPYLEYARLLSERGSKLLGSGGPAGLGYDHTVATTWKVTLESIRLEHPASVELLQLCAFLAPEAIPENLFRGGGLALPGALRSAAADRLNFEETVGLLARYSLVRRNDGQLSVHRLVQHVVRSALSEPETEERIRCCLRLLERSFSSQAEATAADTPLRSMALPHALALAPHAVGVDPQATEQLLLHAADYMAERAQIEGLQGGLELAHVIASQIHGSDNPEVAPILTVLGRVLRTKGDPTTAAAALERALAIIEAVYGPDYPGAVNVLNELGQTLEEQGDPERAVVYLERALRIEDRRHGA